LSDAGRIEYVFNLGPGEVTVLVLLGLIFFGPKRLPEIGEGLREQVWRLRERTRNDPRRQWTWSDWFAASVALVVGSFALALALVAG
jgi:hypothetical protein